MKQMTHRSITAALILISAFIFSCSDSESRVPYYLKTAKVIINLGLPADHASAGTSIIDRVLRFFSRDAVAQSAPATFDSIFVRVTGPDMGPIEKTFAASSSISFEVPAGSLRQFEVIAYVAPGDPSAAASFRGTGAASLPAGSSVTVLVAMSLYETKILIPDRRNYRIIMINDLNSGISTWTPRTAADLGLITLYPNDFSYDSSGRIYIANNTSDESVIRMDDINGKNMIVSSATVFGTGAPIADVVTIAVDRVNNYVYFATTSALYRSNLDGTGTIQLELLPATLPGGNYIEGIDVDSAGKLYIVNHPLSAGINMLSKYDPTDGSHMGDYQTAPLYNPWDVLVRGSYIYVANFGGASGDYPEDGSQVLLFSCDSSNAITLLDTYGNKTVSPDTRRGYFYGASRFLAIRRDDLIIADTDQQYSNIDKLVSMTDILGSNWNTFGQYGTAAAGPGYFKLYSGC